MTLGRFAILAGVFATGLVFSSAAGAQETVKIGAAVSLTGNFAREGNLLKNGYAYWEKLINDAGGIDVGGKKTKVEVVYYDDESKPQSSARLTEKLITEDNVKFILGPYSSGIATATAAISEKYKVVTMTPMATADSLYQRGYKFIFCPAPLASTTLDPMLELIKKLPTPPTTVAIAGPDDLFPNVFAAAAQKKAEALGLKIVYNNKYPKGSVDLSSVATALKDANPEVMILTGYVQDLIAAGEGAAIAEGQSQDDRLRLCRRHSGCAERARSGVGGSDRCADLGSRCEIQGPADQGCRELHDRI